MSHHLRFMAAHPSCQRHALFDRDVSVIAYPQRAELSVVKVVNQGGKGSNALPEACLGYNQSVVTA